MLKSVRSESRLLALPLLFISYSIDLLCPLNLSLSADSKVTLLCREIMYLSTISLPLSVVGFLSCLSYVSAAGWTLDESCSGEVGTKVRDSMNIAFQMAEDAFNELDKSPVNEDVLKVYSYLFMNTEDVRDKKVKGKLRT